MEKYRLVDTSEGSVITYDFFGFDDWRDFDKIVSIIKENIRPTKIDWQGIEDMNGYFEKEGLLVNLEYDSMGQNYIEFKGEQTKENLAKVKGWAELIFNKLMAGVKA